VSFMAFSLIVSDQLKRPTRLDVPEIIPHQRARRRRHAYRQAMVRDDCHSGPRSAGGIAAASQTRELHAGRSSLGTGAAGDQGGDIL
jgi:hypothetical protein